MNSERFSILQCLGEGGFGEVYLAEDGGQKVALKVLHRGLSAASQAVQRLRDEARLLKLLDHRNILKIHDIVEIDGRIALVTEYIEGEDLESMFASVTIQPRAATEVLAEVAEALQNAYEAVGPSGEPLHLLHRDVKPANIRLARTGGVKLLDFGIAKATGVEREAQTQTSGVIGSFAYMAPERFEPKRPQGPAGDVYSLGAIFYEALSGGNMLLHDLDISELFALALVESRRDEAVLPRLAALEVPSRAMDLLEELLSYDPDERPTLQDLPRRFRRVAKDLDGPPLVEWAPARSWPEVGTKSGSLTGSKLAGRPLVMEDGTLFVRSETPAPAPQIRQTERTLEAPETSETTAPPIAPAIESASSRLPLLAGVAALAGVGLLGVGLVLLFVGAGSMWSIDVAEDTDAVVVVEPDPSLIPGPTPQPVLPEIDTGAPDKPVPLRTPVVPGQPQQPEPVQQPEPHQAGAGDVERCGELAELQLNVLALPTATRACLSAALVDSTLRQVDRDKLGRVLLVAEQDRCAQGECMGYESAQRTFFKEVSRSDAELMAAFSEYLWKTANGKVGRAMEASRWAGRAMERGSQWKSGTFATRTLRMHEIRARAAYLAWQDRSNNEAGRSAAKQRAAEWAEVLRRFSKDAEPAMELCASAAGNREACEKRVTTEAATESIRFLSVPFGAEVSIDGKKLGKTVLEVPLAHGTHQVVMTLSGTTSTKTITVGGGEAVQWRWTREGDAWTGGH